MEEGAATGAEGLTAHWLLGRVAVASAMIDHVQRRPEMDEMGRELLLERANAALAEVATVLGDLARGLPPLLPVLREADPQP